MPEIVENPPSPDCFEALVSVGIAWGLDSMAADRLAHRALAPNAMKGDIRSIDDICVVMLASMNVPTPDLIKIAARMVSLWQHVKSGTLPWAAMTHAFEAEIIVDGRQTRRDVTFTLLMDPRCIVFGSCLDTGQPYDDEMSVLRTDGDPVALTDEDPDPCPVEARRFDALVTEAALTALEEGRRPILLLRNIAEECEIEEPEDED